MTPGRLAWLLTLRDNPGAGRPKSRVGIGAMQAGLTQWRWVDRSTHARVAPPPMPYPAGWHDQHEVDGEELTDAGRRALEDAEADKSGTIPG